MAVAGLLVGCSGSFAPISCGVTMHEWEDGVDAEQGY